MYCFVTSESFMFIRTACFTKKWILMYELDYMPQKELQAHAFRVLGACFVSSDQYMLNMLSYHMCICICANMSFFMSGAVNSGTCHV